MAKQLATRRTHDHEILPAARLFCRDGLGRLDRASISMAAISAEVKAG
jgi:hypothetical protein